MHKHTNTSLAILSVDILALVCYNIIKLKQKRGNDSNDRKDETI